MRLDLFGDGVVRRGDGDVHGCRGVPAYRRKEIDVTADKIGFGEYDNTEPVSVAEPENSTAKLQCFFKRVVGITHRTGNDCSLLFLCREFLFKNSESVVVCPDRRKIIDAVTGASSVALDAVMGTAAIEICRVAGGEPSVFPIGGEDGLCGDCLHKCLWSYMGFRGYGSCRYGRQIPQELAKNTRLYVFDLQSDVFHELSPTIWGDDFCLPPKRPQLLSMRPGKGRVRTDSFK